MCFGGPVWGRRAGQTSGASVCVRHWLPPNLETLPEGGRGVQNRPAGQRPSQLFRRRGFPHGLTKEASACWQAGQTCDGIVARAPFPIHPQRNKRQRQNGVAARPFTRLARVSGLRRLARWRLRGGGRGSQRLQDRIGPQLGCRCRLRFWSRNSRLPCVLKRDTEHRPENRDNNEGCCASWAAPLPAFPSVAVSNTTTRGALVDGGPPLARVPQSPPGTPKLARGQPNLATTMFSPWAADSQRIGPVRSQGSPGRS